MSPLSPHVGAEEGELIGVVTEIAVRMIFRRGCEAYRVNHIPLEHMSNDGWWSGCCLLSGRKGDLFRIERYT